jgi:hypothetical protein
MMLEEGPDPEGAPVGLVRSPVVLTFNERIWGGRF